MNKYKVEFKQTETFIIDVLAKDEKDAREKALKGWENEEYQETGDVDISISYVYDVTETEDPFFP